MRDSEAAASAETRPTAAMTARPAFFAPRSESFRPQTPSTMSRWTVCAASTISESSVESIAENTAANYDARDYRMEFLHDERRKGELGVCDRGKHEAAGEAEQSAARGLDEHPRDAEDGRPVKASGRRAPL